MPLKRVYRVERTLIQKKNATLYFFNKKLNMIYTKEINDMCVVAKGPNHGPAPIPEEGKWIQAKEIKDISGMTHGMG